jgi:gliding motility-associated-like protein
VPSQFVEADPAGNGTFYATTSGSTEYYYVTVPYSGGCSGFDSVLIVYKPCEALLKIPNVFTPNGDQVNDEYHIKDLCKFEDFKFIIYNRWGKLIYEATDPEFAWDGKTTGGTDVSDGVYYYIMHTRKNEYHGTIEIIRH